MIFFVLNFCFLFFVLEKNFRKIGLFFFNVILYFFRPVIKVLVAFAVGALCGDAFIHLIPLGFG